jgi:hypothetical protein
VIAPSARTFPRLCTFSALVLILRVLRRKNVLIWFLAVKFLSSTAHAGEKESNVDHRQSAATEQPPPPTRVWSEYGVASIHVGFDAAHGAESCRAPLVKARRGL